MKMLARSRTAGIAARLTAATATALLFGAFVTGPSAHATTFPGTGGCSHAVAGGFDADICISYSNGTVYPDYYINSYTNGCVFPELTVWGRPHGGTWVQPPIINNQPDDCHLGHHGPFPIAAQHNWEYIAALQLTDRWGHAVWWLESPIQYVS